MSIHVGAQIQSPAIEEPPPAGPDRRSLKSLSFVQRQLAATPVRPPVTVQNWTKEVIWFNLGTVLLTPIVSLWGLYTTAFTAHTVAFCVFYYVFNMIGA